MGIVESLANIHPPQMSSTRTTPPAPIVVKVQYGTSLVRRRVDYPGALTLSDLRAMAGLAGGTASYVDDEGDSITIATEDDLREAVAFAAETAGRVLRVTMLVAEEEDKSSSLLNSKREETVSGLQDSSLRTESSVRMYNQQLWSRTRQLVINFAFLGLFGAFCIKLALSIVTSTFGVIFSTIFILLKLVPLCAMALLYFKVSGKNALCLRSVVSGQPLSLGFCKRVVCGRFNNMRCIRLRGGAEMPSPPTGEDDDPCHVEQIVSMGFDPIEAQEALAQAGGSLTGALNMLLSARN